MSDRYLSLKKASELIDVSESTIRRWVGDRKIRSYKFGGCIRIRESDLIAFAEVRESIDEMVKKIFNRQ